MLADKTDLSDEGENMSKLLNESPFLLSEHGTLKYDTLSKWSATGLRSGINKKGPVVKLETCRLPTGKATSLAAIRRFEEALNLEGC
jgi:hypothetical protein